MEEEEDHEGTSPLNPEPNLDAPIIQMIALEEAHIDDPEMDETKQDDDTIWIEAKTMSSQLFAQDAQDSEPPKALEEMVPPKYHDYLDIFSKDTADHVPDSKPWDHEIKLKEGFTPKSFKTYNLTPRE